MRANKVQKNIIHCFLLFKNHIWAAFAAGSCPWSWQSQSQLIVGKNTPWLISHHLKAATHNAPCILCWCVFLFIWLIKADDSLTVWSDWDISTGSYSGYWWRKMIQLPERSIWTSGFRVGATSSHWHVKILQVIICRKGRQSTFILWHVWQNRAEVTWKVRNASRCHSLLL